MKLQVTQGLLTAVALLFMADAAIAQTSTAQTLRVAFVDSRVIMDRAPGRREAEALFQRETAPFEAQVKAMSDSLNAMIAAYQKKEPALNQADKEKEQKTIRDKQAEYQERTQKLQQQAQARETELVQPILDQVRKVLDEIRAENGYAVVFDLSGATGAIVAYDKNLDITERVIARLKPVTLGTKTDTSKAPTGRPAPAGVRKPPAQ
ncbi:MAG TPA: OmpH family outer membrane protein [Gemmatimonadaceae bacterium]|nr:OmpH family outer membrane protein [Gemmatimonadaceae bacterium]